MSAQYGCRVNHENEHRPLNCTRLKRALVSPREVILSTGQAIRSANTSWLRWSTLIYRCISAYDGPRWPLRWPLCSTSVREVYTKRSSRYRWLETARMLSSHGNRSVRSRRSSGRRHIYCRPISSGAFRPRRRFDKWCIETTYSIYGIRNELMSLKLCLVLMLALPYHAVCNVLKSSTYTRPLVIWFYETP